MGNCKSKKIPVPQKEDTPMGPSVELHVYNLHAKKPGSRGVKELLGFGLYHTGIVVFNQEWSFGGMATTSSPGVCGIFACPPKSALPAMLFEESILLGTLPHGTLPQQIYGVLERMRQKWGAATYHLLRHNCNHFTHAFRDALAKEFPKAKIRSIPAYVNRAARVANVFVPESLYRSMLQGSEKATPHGTMPEAFNAARTTSGISAPDENVVRSIPVPASREALQAMTIREIKTMMWVNGISWDGCVEKEDLIRTVEEWRKLHPKAAKK